MMIFQVESGDIILADYLKGSSKPGSGRSIIVGKLAETSMFYLSLDLITGLTDEQVHEAKKNIGEMIRKGEKIITCAMVRDSLKD